jgi:hypothetical protein
MTFGFLCVVLGLLSELDISASCGVDIIDVTLVHRNGDVPGRLLELLAAASKRNRRDQDHDVFHSVMFVVFVV